MVKKIHKTEEEWKKILTPEQYKIMREKGTEQAFCGAFYNFKEGGVYYCVACDLPLFRSSSKFDSKTGWPSFFEPYNDENVINREDNSLGMNRTETLCARCDSHLGHVFPDPPRASLAESRRVDERSSRVEAGGPSPTRKRYCINSIALKFKSDEK